MKKRDITVVIGVVILFVIVVFFAGSGVSLRPSKEVGVVRVEGAIGSSAQLVKWIDTLRKNKKIRGILLYINSPGGGAVASDEIYRALVRFKNTNRPIVAYISSVGASGGYYVACAADKIVINPSSITGSIGVIAEFPEFDGLLKKVGVKMRVIKSGKHKDIGSPFREMTESERRVIQNLINQTYETFVEVVAKGRGLPVDSVKSIGDGRIYSGKEAVKLGLCDTTGDFNTAKEVMKQILGLKNIRLVERKKPFSFKDLIFKSKLPFGMVLSYRMVP